MSRVLQVPAVALNGLQMIEASAGTGKTWTIAALYLRLLLERALPVEKILVVTYTNAATAELRARIRQRLLEAQQACALVVESEDEVLREIFKVVPRERAQVLLTLALESFDLAAIHTIHGFCQRALAERAFESGLPFDTELASDDRRVLHESVEDFWRREVAANDDPLWLGWLLSQLAGPGDLLAQLSSQFGKPYLLKVSAPAWDATAAQRFTDTTAHARSVWQREGAVAVEKLLAHGGLHKTYYKPEAIKSLASNLDVWLSADLPALPLPKNLERLTQGFIADKTNAKQVTPEHGVYVALEQLNESALLLEQAFANRLGALLQQALSECEASVRKARQRVATRSFDDLLLDLHAALAGEHGSTLAVALRQRYAAALVDEFQDTDPLQYEIFAQVFAHESVPLFFVGDPKQAIYSFRGADLRAYLEAKQQAGEPLVLDTNWRSSSALIESVNSLFSRERPFLDADLNFEPVHASAKAPGPLLLQGKEAPALEVWFVPRIDKEAEPNSKGRLGVIAKNRATPTIAEAVAEAVAELLNAASRNEAMIDGRPLAGQDIAVLVKSHYQGQQVRDELQRCGVASVHYGQDSIFGTQDAVEVERILLAIAYPSREGLVRSALATRLMGVRGDELAALAHMGVSVGHGAAWLQRLEDFHRWHVLARDHGFIRMWRTWQLEAEVAPRLLALPEGERLMTNLLHLSDLLATMAHDEGLGVEALAKHLADARYDQRGDHDTGEGRLLRLESDENLVRIVTIHTSKGLEYPVTFCPFLWDAGLKDRPGPVRYHDPELDHRAALDFGSLELEHHKEIAHHEARAEALRLAYVALTRAKQHCVLVWGAMKGAESSPLAWLLHGSEKLDFGGKNDDELRAELAQLSKASAHIQVRDLPVPQEVILFADVAKQAELKARAYPARALLPWRMHSFTAWLVNPGERVPSSDELPDHDAQAVIPLEIGADAEVSKFPCGANAGTCLHDMFERIEFDLPDAAVVAESLTEFGFDPALQPVALALLNDVLQTPMGVELPALAAIPMEQQVREMEFMLPITAPDMVALAHAVGKGAGADGRLAERIRSLQPAHLSGFLKGFVDLVFAHEGRYFVLDYKSNHLGPQMRDYAQAQLAVGMSEAMYDLQALLYQVALHRALKQRLPDYDYDTHCGGSLYFFLRGMQPSVPGSGVFAWRPERELIERVDAVLATKQRVFEC